MSVDKNNKTLAIIPARKGSKRLPGKNTLIVSGKPMINYTIDAALKSKYINKIAITTDDEKVIDIAQKYKDSSGDKLTVINRPKELSTNNVPTLPVLEHVLQNISDEYTIVVLLQPTSPLRTEEHIDSCIETLIKEDCSSLITVKEIQPFHLFVPNGAIYITSRELIIKHNKLKDDNVRLVLMSEEASIDVDTKTDLILAEVLLGRKNENRQ
jgi:CMP-N-acetylneuraminic acid synthetase